MRFSSIIERFLVLGIVLSFCLILVIHLGLLKIENPGYLKASQMGRQLFLVKDQQKVIVTFKSKITISNGIKVRYRLLDAPNLIVETPEKEFITITLSEISKIRQYNYPKRILLAGYFSGLIGYLYVLQKTERTETRYFSNCGVSGSITEYTYDPETTLPFWYRGGGCGSCTHPSIL